MSVDAGSEFKSFYDSMLASLTASSRGTTSSLLPSFLHFIVWLVDQRRDFHLVFRTFGSDLPWVTTEWNRFVTGQHPCFPGFRADGSETLDLRLDMTQGSFGHIVRTGDSLADVFFRNDVTEPPPAGDPAAIQAWTATAAALTDDPVSHTFRSWISKHSVCAVRDCYDWWSQRDRVSSAGKPMFLMPRVQATEFEIFFGMYGVSGHHRNASASCCCSVLFRWLFAIDKCNASSCCFC